MNRRRKFILGGSALAIGAYSYHRGLRYPRLGYEPRPLAIQISHSNNHLSLHDLIITDSDNLGFRAYAPEPILEIDLDRGQINLSVTNLAVDAKLVIIAPKAVDIDEQALGTKRQISIETKEAQSVALQWKLPNQERLKFAVIGDTGGNTELDWCLKRAYQLGAQFLLHLGDFNYGNDDYPRAIEYFNNSPLPCYVSIGNHDFNDSGLVYRKFLRNIGPLNHSFSIAGTRFVNLDTGADFFPASGGLRGDLMSELIQNPNQNQVFFTHRPLRDPRPDEDHNVGGINEVNWLASAIKASGGGPLLTGHVHHSAELKIQNVQQYSVGEGLGFEDILLQRQVSQLLIGNVSVNKAPSFEWAELDMPWEYHQSHTHAKKLKKRGDQRILDWYQTMISKQT